MCSLTDLRLLLLVDARSAAPTGDNDIPVKKIVFEVVSDNAAGHESRDQFRFFDASSALHHHEDVEEEEVTSSSGSTSSMSSSSSSSSSCRWDSYQCYDTSASTNDLKKKYKKANQPPSPPRRTTTPTSTAGRRRLLRRNHIQQEQQQQCNSDLPLKKPSRTSSLESLEDIERMKNTLEQQQQQQVTALPPLELWSRTAFDQSYHTTSLKRRPQRRRRQPLQQRHPSPPRAPVKRQVFSKSA